MQNFGNFGQMDPNSVNLNTTPTTNGTGFQDMSNPNFNMGLYGMYPNQSNMNN